jgi:uncharacterized phage protein (TIGR01671 family)
MREIKFRAWDNIAGRFKTGTELAETIIRVELDGAIELKGAIYNISEVTLMQYTGLKDSNGVEVYEGDILRDYNNYPPGHKHGLLEQTGVATYSVLLGGWYIVDSRGLEHEQKTLQGATLEYFEVIGNKYENPELVEEAK